jgi:hypothetical protein
VDEDALVRHPGILEHALSPAQRLAVPLEHQRPSQLRLSAGDLCRGRQISNVGERLSEDRDGRLVAVLSEHHASLVCSAPQDAQAVAASGVKFTSLSGVLLANRETCRCRRRRRGALMECGLFQRISGHLERLLEIIQCTDRRVQRGRPLRCRP